MEELRLEAFHEGKGLGLFEKLAVFELAWEELHAVEEPHLVGLLLHRDLSFLFWIFLLSGLYLCILWDLFPNVLDNHSD